MFTPGTFGYHSNLYDQLMSYLIKGTVTLDDFEIEQNVSYIPAKSRLDFKVDEFPLRGQQPLVVNHICSSDGILLRTAVIPAQTGMGKCQPLYSLIKTPTGWEMMGDIQIGDSVTAKDGTVTEVTGVYPQGIKDVYEITFADGRSTKCGAEHLWKVFYIDTTVARRWQVVNTLEVIRLISMPNPRVYIDLIDSEDCVDIHLPMEPYILGCFLCDGHSGKNYSNITTPDEFIVEEISRLLPPELKLVRDNQTDRYPSYKFSSAKANDTSNDFNKALKTFGLYRHLSFMKFIPKVYLRASREQRLAILQGLLDTDGTVTSHGTVSYSTTSEQLAKDVQYLVRSLGGIASIKSRYTNYTYLNVIKQGRNSYNVNIRHKEQSMLFRLPRKKILMNDNNQYAKTLKLRVKCVKFVGREETQCISISHPDHLYVTDDFIVTHNTASSLYSVYLLKVRVSLSMSKGYMQSWIDDLAKFFHNDTSQYLVVDSGTKFRKIIEDAKNDKLQNLNIIIFSLDILRAYFKEFELTGESSYGCLPENLYQLLGVGIRISDEAHEDIHFQFRHDIHTHVNKSVYLSATIESLDPFTNLLYSILYPKNSRLLGLIWEKYIIGVSLGYSLREPRRAQYTGAKGYSHTRFEKWIMSNRTVRENYFRMILFFMERGFVRNYNVGHKLLVYMATIKMCDKFTEYVRKNITNKTLRISSFTGTDEALVLTENDILISTPIKSGTGRNILGLVAVVSTVAIQSIQTVTQMSGRIRQIDKLFPGVEPTFYDLVCTSIPKHMSYYQTKQELFKRQFLRQSTHNTNFEI
jgi:hypothetical protein